MDRLTSKTFQQKDSSNKWQFCTKVCVSPKLVTLFLRYIRAEYKDNKNALTGRANCKKATRHHAHLPLIAKSRKSNDGQSTKEQKTSSWAIFWRFRRQISPNWNFFWKFFMFSTNVRPKTKKIVRAVFWEKYQSIWFWANFRPFCEYLQIENFFQKSGSVTFYLYSPLTSCKKWEKSLEPFLRKLRYKPTNQPTNQLLPATPILKDLADTGLKSSGWHQSKKPDMSDSHRNARVLCNYKLKLPKF